MGWCLWELCTPLTTAVSFMCMSESMDIRNIDASQLFPPSKKRWMGISKVHYKHIHFLPVPCCEKFSWSAGAVQRGIYGRKPNILFSIVYMYHCKSTVAVILLRKWTYASLPQLSCATILEKCLFQPRQGTRILAFGSFLFTHPWKLLMTQNRFTYLKLEKKNNFYQKVIPPFIKNKGTIAQTNLCTYP